jgi:hypothetical protein
MGYYSRLTSTDAANSVGIGHGAKMTSHCTVIGNSASAIFTGATAIGYKASTVGTAGISISGCLSDDSEFTSAGRNSVAIGHIAQATGVNSISIGTEVKTTAGNTITLGNTSTLNLQIGPNTFGLSSSTGFLFNEQPKIKTG